MPTIERETEGCDFAERSANDLAPDPSASLRSAPPLLRRGGTLRCQCPSDLSTLITEKICAALALAKIAAALPREKRTALEATPLFAPGYFIEPAVGERLDLLRRAIHARRHVQLNYTDINGISSQRTVRSLACAFWGGTWTLAAWCERRDGFRSFRLDRIDTLEILETQFSIEAGKTLADFLRTLKPENRS